MDAYIGIGIEGAPPRTEDMLNFVVVGGGLAGLSTASALRKVGHRTAVLERRPVEALAECREGVRSAPTMTQILNEWGLWDEMSQISLRLNQITFFKGQTGEELGLIAVSGKVMETFPAALVNIQYGKLFGILYDRAKDAGVDLRFDTKVVAVDPLAGMVTCEDGLQLMADVVVGADGTESIVRPVVLGSSAEPPDCDNRFTLSLVAPADEARKDKDLAALLDTKDWLAWVADDCCLHGALSASKKGPGPGYDFSTVLSIPIWSEDEREAFPMDLEPRLNLFEPRAQKLIRLSTQISKVVFDHYEPFDNWVHESGKVVLIGEAAHPIVPCSSHSASACIEDAMTLSTLFSLPATKPQTPMLLNVFEELRQPRCAALQRYIRRKREVVNIPHGPAQQKRDALLRTQRAYHIGDEMDDDFLYNTYAGFIQIFAFDAREVVQDWWVTWGRSIFMRPESEGEDDGDCDAPPFVPVVVDAEIERQGPMYPIIYDPTFGEAEDVVREAEAHRRGQQ